MKKKDDGFIYPDPTKVEVPLKLRRAVQEGDRFKQLVQRFSEYQARQGNESLEEADDFDVDDGDGDLDFISQQELTDMQEEGQMDDASFRAKRGKFFPGHKRTESVHKKDSLDKDKDEEDTPNTVNKDRDKGDKDGRKGDGER